jgi:hypothetical protein
MPPLYLQEQNHKSGRYAVAEDDGTTIWLYLTATDSITPIADVWIHNSTLNFTPDQAPEPAAVPNAPPPAPNKYIGENGFYSPNPKDEWSLFWSADGHSVAIMLNGQPVGFINAEEKTGYCRNLLEECPWGKVFDEGKFQNWFS